MPAPPIMDLTTTSVGRSLIRTTYQSFFDHISYAGTFNVIVTVDRAYGVSEREFQDTVAFLEKLPAIYPKVSSVTVEVQERNTHVAYCADCFHVGVVRVEI